MIESLLFPPVAFPSGSFPVFFVSLPVDFSSSCCRELCFSAFLPVAYSPTKVNSITQIPCDARFHNFCLYMVFMFAVGLMLNTHIIL